MTLRYQRHWPEDISVPMPQHSGPLWMRLAAPAGDMSSGCYRHRGTPVQYCCRGLGKLSVK
eukprot:8165684-Karenia_brevis.AAC.1